MSGVLVAYASKNGATAEIAVAIAEELRTAGLEVDCAQAGEVSGLSDYDAVVLGSAVYMKRWLKPARRLLRRGGLAERPLWLFSSGPCGTDPDPSWAEPKRVADMADRLGARDHTIFGGRLPVDPDGFVERAMLNGTPEELRDLRDWDEIRGWVAGIAAELVPKD